MSTATKTSEELAQLFDHFHRTGDVDARNRLMEMHLHLVRMHAERIHVKLPKEVQLDDLISAGSFGLLAAVKAFDPARGIRFSTYCAGRIQGAILDWIREFDWVPRLARSRSRKLSIATKQLRNDLGREPTRADLMRRIGVSPGEFAKIEADAGTIPETVSLSRKWYQTGGDKEVREVDVIADTTAPDAALNLERADLKQFILRGLTRAERLIVTLYYYEDLTMKQIGRALDLSESRVSQMHSSIIARLKARTGDGLAELLSTEAA